MWPEIRSQRRHTECAYYKGDQEKKKPGCVLKEGQTQPGYRLGAFFGPEASSCAVDKTRQWAEGSAGGKDFFRNRRTTREITP
jgi:hypothetical protein